MPPGDKRSYFNELAPRWDSFPGPEDAEARIRALVEKGSASPVAGWILDAGCGTGVLLPALLERHPWPCRILELDFAEDMLRVNAAKGAGERRTRHVCADVQHLPLPDNSLDLAFCFGLFPHLAQPEQALKEMLRALRPGGTLAVGHLMASRELNAFHSTVDGPVREDRLPPAQELAQVLLRLGACSVHAEEAPGFYLVRAVKARL